MWYYFARSGQTNLMYAKILLMVVCTNAYPLNQDAAGTPLHDLKFVSYVQNFKHTMADYVNNEYRHLTVHEKEKVESILEEFLLDFGKDLTEVLILREENKSDKEGKVNAIDHSKVKLDDGVSEATAREIKATLLREFPDIREEEAVEIVYRIRLNLLATRKKLDEVIERSKIALISNS